MLKYVKDCSAEEILKVYELNVENPDYIGFYKSVVAMRDYLVKTIKDEEQMRTILNYSFEEVKRQLEDSSLKKLIKISEE